MSQAVNKRQHGRIESNLISRIESSATLQIGIIVMFKALITAVVLAALGGCATPYPYQEPIRESLLLTAAQDGSKEILASTTAYQYNGNAALQWVDFFVTPNGAYAAYWDGYSDTFGLSYQIANADIESVTIKTFKRGWWAEGTMLVVRDIKGNEYGFTAPPGSEVELALKRNLATKQH